MIAIRKPWALYNEIDPYAADWLENLIARGAIAPGLVDRRSIEDLTADELGGFRQVHFFAGIGVWSYALRRAGVSDDTPLWTGSCPCQPFSAAGKGGGVADERHLWPAWHHLIRECRPREVFGEQVASKDGLGWLDLVSADMEASDYAFWAVDTCSAGSGAPHIRQRLRFGAYDLRSAAGGLSKPEGEGFDIGTRPASQGSQFPKLGLGYDDFSSGLDDLLGEGLEGFRCGHRSKIGQRKGSLRSVAASGEPQWMADNSSPRVRDQERGPDAGTSAGGESEGYQWERFRYDPWHDDGREPVELACRHDDERRPDLSQWGSEGRTVDGRRGPTVRLADNERVGWQWWEGSEDGNVSDRQNALGEKVVRGVAEPDQTRSVGHNGGPRWAGPTNAFWRDADWLFCRDGKWRPVEPGTFPLVDGSSFRVGSGSAFEGKSRQGMLKGYGNAIDAEATIDFLTAYLERDLIDIEHEPIRATDPFADLLG